MLQGHHLSISYIKILVWYHIYRSTLQLIQTFHCRVPHSLLLACQMEEYPRKLSYTHNYSSNHKCGHYSLWVSCLLNHLILVLLRVVGLHKLSLQVLLHLLLSDLGRYIWINELKIVVLGAVIVPVLSSLVLIAIIGIQLIPAKQLDLE